LVVASSARKIIRSVVSSTLENDYSLSMSEEEKKPVADQPGDGENEKRTKGNRSRFAPRGSGGTTKFEGRCNDLKGHIYDCANTAKAADMYTKTTREIIEYIGRTFKYSSGLCQGYGITC
jgi:hypothetical protein